MKLLPAYLASGLAGLVAAALPVHAGDLSNGAAGGIKDYGSAGIAVPAPMPYEDTYKWYLRGDLGTGVKHNGTIDTGNWPITLSQPGSWHELSIVSLGFGRYITPSFRTEFTLDYRTDRNLASGLKTLPDKTASARTADTSATIGASTVPVVNVATNYYHGTQDESVTYQNSTFLMSGFYDFNHGGKLRPYIGAGAGIALHQLHRSGIDTYNCYNGTVTSTPLGFGPTTYPSYCTTTTGTNPLQLQYVNTSSAVSVGYGVAAQLSAGLTYDLSSRTHWDTGYRMLWQSGRIGVASSDGLNTIRINDRFDHEIRSGVRWDLW